MMNCRALITGVSGFVGGVLAEHLLAHGDMVLGTSPNGQWLDSSPQRIQDQIDLVAWDLAQPDGLEPGARRAIEQFAPTVIYHLAAISVPSQCGQEEPTPLAVEINVHGTRRVLELAASLPSAPRVLAISSSHVYAPVTIAAPRVDEQSPVMPKRGYGRTKLAAEEEIRRAVSQGSVNAIIVRAFQHTGPGQGPQMMLPGWAMQFAQGGDEPVKVRTLDAWIDLTDVRDVVRAYRLLALKGQSGEVYNVGSGVARRSGDVFECLHCLASSHRKVIELAPGFKQDPIADITRLTALTDWKPEIPLEQTVQDTYRWWLQRGEREE
jgi:GDP-4-dehydro-6-deoxy-D-mannose reductase